MSQLFHASADQDLHYFLLVCHVSTEDACIEAMRPFGFSRANVRGWTGTAAENARMLDNQIAALDQKLAEAKEHLASFAPQRGSLRRLCGPFHPGYRTGRSHKPSDRHRQRVLPAGLDPRRKQKHA